MAQILHDRKQVLRRSYGTTYAPEGCDGESRGMSLWSAERTRPIRPQGRQPSRVSLQSCSVQHVIARSGATKQSPVLTRRGLLRA